MESHEVLKNPELSNFIDVKEVSRLCGGLARSTIWRMTKKGTFPAPVQLSERRIGWRRSDIEAWLRSRPVPIAYFRAAEKIMIPRTS